MIKYNEAQSI